ncbi:MAG TPA: VWA domain-containing protein [Blastocatellia bacterium]|nr:VWA domain-containing protein [Blastocatellia bacterium]
MKKDKTILPVLCFILTIISLLSLATRSQERSSSRSKNGQASEAKVSNTVAEPDDKPAPARAEDVRLAVDLVVLDAQVLQQKTGRSVGFLKREDFVLSEDGVQQQITHFGQDSLPLSVLFVIDRGGCLDPFSEKVRRAILESMRRLKPQDEVGLMAFHNTTELVARFSHNQGRIIDGLDHLPPHDEEANHCFNRAFYDAAEYMRRAGNPDGRRVIIVITSVTTYFDCSGPSGDEARRAIFESGSVVCGIIPKTVGQRMESGIMRTVTGIGGVFKARSSNLNQLAEETGGEVLTDKPENLDHTFNDLIDHLRTRYVIGFVSTNPKRDGSFRKLKLEIAPSVQKPDSKLIVKTRRGYIASKRRTT